MSDTPMPGEFSEEEQWHILDQGRKLEYVCPHCGLVLFEGPDFVDFTGGNEWRRYVFPRRCKGWLRTFARKVARQRNE